MPYSKSIIKYVYRVLFVLDRCNYKQYYKKYRRTIACHLRYKMGGHRQGYGLRFPYPMDHKGYMAMSCIKEIFIKNRAYTAAMKGKSWPDFSTTVSLEFRLIAMKGFSEGLKERDRIALDSIRSEIDFMRSFCRGISADIGIYTFAKDRKLSVTMDGEIDG